MKGTGNKNDNGVLEIGTDEIVSSYQEDTPGQQVEKYLSQIAQVNEERQKKHFSTKYPNPLKGFPYNESKLEEKNCGCGKTPCETYGESYEEVQEAAPKMKKLSIYGSEVSGLKRTDKGKGTSTLQYSSMSTYTAKPVVLKGKLAFRVEDTQGAFETLDLLSFAKMYG
jgi:hypothetical protein|tara:strand:- start:1606 stop:2109 length:504 start_codon:yes stop_codon:yes gene_type:complete